MAALSPSLGPPPAVRVASAPEPGRVRLTVDGLQGNASRARAVEVALSRRAGVRVVSANPLTGHVLVLFDPARCTTAQVVRTTARTLGLRDLHAADPPLGELTLRSATPGRLRLAVQGLHQRPERESAVGAALAAVPGVRLATATARTGTALVHYATADAPLRGLLERLQAAVCAALAAAEPVSLATRRSAPPRPSPSSPSGRGGRRGT